MLRLKLPDGSKITLSEEHPAVAKIRSGFAYSIDQNGQITIGTKTELDLDEMETKLLTGTATLADARAILLAIVRAMKRSPSLFDQ